MWPQRIVDIQHDRKRGVQPIEEANRELEKAKLEKAPDSTLGEMGTRIARLEGTAREQAKRESEARVARDELLASFARLEPPARTGQDGGGWKRFADALIKAAAEWNPQLAKRAPMDLIARTIAVASLDEGGEPAACAAQVIELCKAALNLSGAAGLHEFVGRGFWWEREQDGVDREAAFLQVLRTALRPDAADNGFATQLAHDAGKFFVGRLTKWPPTTVSLKGCVAYGRWLAPRQPAQASAYWGKVERRLASDARWGDLLREFVDLTGIPTVDVPETTGTPRRSVYVPISNWLRARRAPPPWSTTPGGLKKLVSLERHKAAKRGPLGTALVKMMQGKPHLQDLTPGFLARKLWRALKAELGRAGGRRDAERPGEGIRRQSVKTVSSS